MHFTQADHAEPASAEYAFCLFASSVGRLLQHFLGDQIQKGLELRPEDETVQPRLVGNDSSRLHADLYAEYRVQKHAEHN